MLEAVQQPGGRGDVKVQAELAHVPENVAASEMRTVIRGEYEVTNQFAECLVSPEMTA